MPGSFSSQQHHLDFVSKQPVAALGSVVPAVKRHIDNWKERQPAFHAAFWLHGCALQTM
jgi:hypothetical protein